jgi:sialate O-acetylesterase
MRAPMKMVRHGIWLALLLAATGVMADLRLPRLLSDGVILQRDTPARLWGWAETGATVRVWLDETAVGTVEASDGRFQLWLPPQAAGGPHRLRFEGGH